MKRNQTTPLTPLDNQSLTNYQVLSGSAIKVIALVTMFIDHFGAIVLSFIRVNIFNFYGLWQDQLPTYYFTVYERVAVAYDICRMIGRIAFPLFCFLLVEGFIYTRNRKKYALRLFIFALISELPFDFAFYSHIDNPEWPFNIGECNIFFTLLIGLFAMAVIDYFDKRSLTNKGFLKKIIIVILQCTSVYILAELADKIGTDYGAYGIFMIAILYYFRKDRIKQVVITFLYMMFYLPLGVSFQPTYLISLLCMLLYNGQKGKIRLKYFFYAFYPLHLIFLTLCAFALSSIYKVPYKQSYETDNHLCFYLNEKLYCTLEKDKEQVIVQDHNWLDTHLVIRYAKGPVQINAKIVGAKGEVLAETTIEEGTESEPLFIPHQSGNYSVIVCSDQSGEAIFRVYEVYRKSQNSGKMP